MNKINMMLAKKIIDTVVTMASQDGKPPVCVSVCDEEGVLSAFLRMDGTASRICRNAELKAYTAARMQARTEDFLARIKKEDLELDFFCDSRLMPFPGGAPLFNKEGRIIGAVGVSGRASEEDQYMADICSKMVLEHFA